MKARFKYRFYPSTDQIVLLSRLFGCCRRVWNDALAFCKSSPKYPGYSQLSSLLTLAKKSEERRWFKDVSSVPLQQSLKNLDTAYKNFFDSCKGKRKGQRVKPPKFKKKTNTQSATFTKAAFSLSGKSVYLAKIGSLNPIWSRELPSEPSSVTVIKDAANRYFLSFVVEAEPINVAAKNHSIGIDLGIKTFATLSNGEYKERVKSPDYSKLDKRLRHKQKQLARQVKGSRRRGKTRLQIARLHHKIADTRKDFLHKLSSRVVHENQVITLEDLNVSGMVKNRKLSRAISLQGWREFRVMCEAKSEKFGRELTIVSRWEPSSQTCSDCGYKWGKLDLSTRTILCLSCGVEHDRDENSAEYLRKVGIGHCHDSKRTRIDRKTTSVAS